MRINSKEHSKSNYRLSVWNVVNRVFINFSATLLKQKEIFERAETDTPPYLTLLKFHAALIFPQKRCAKICLPIFAQEGCAKIKTREMLFSECTKIKTREILFSICGIIRTCNFKKEERNVS